MKRILREFFESWERMHAQMLEVRFGIPADPEKQDS